MTKNFAIYLAMVVGGIFLISFGKYGHEWFHTACLASGIVITSLGGMAILNDII